MADRRQALRLQQPRLALPQLLLHPMQPGDVAGDPQHAHQPAVAVQHRRLDRLQPGLPPVGGAGEPFLVDRRPAGGDGLLVLLAKEPGQVRVDEGEIGLADDVGLRRPEEPLQLAVAGQVDALGVLQPDDVGDGLEQGAQAAALLLQLRRPPPHLVAQGQGPEGQHPARRHRHQQAVGDMAHIGRPFVPGPDPFVVQSVALADGEGVEAPLDLVEQAEVALADGAVELAAVQGERLVETAVGAGAVEQVVGGRLVQAEDLDPVGGRRGDQVGIAVELLHGGDAVRRQAVDAGIAGLDPHQEAAQRPHVGDAADGFVDVDGDRNVRVGRGEIVVPQPLGGLEDGVDDVGAAGRHDLLRLGPVGGDQPDRPPGLLLPQRPGIHQIAFEPAVGIPEDVGGIIVVGDHGQRRLGRLEAQRRPGRLEAQWQQQPAQHRQGPPRPRRHAMLPDDQPQPRHFHQSATMTRPESPGRRPTCSRSPAPYPNRRIP